MKLKAVSQSVMVALAAVTAGCGISPDSLSVPPEMTCIHLKEAISFTGRYGFSNTPLTTRLERGAYWSEKMDKTGTYYRAPPGGLSIRNEKGAGIPGTGATMDCGFYVPNDEKMPIEIYRYFSTTDAPVEVPPPEADCSTVAYTKDPATTKVSLVNFALGGGASGAAGGVMARGIAQNSNLSYGQSAGVGAAGGAIGGLVVASMINAGAGNIVHDNPIQDPAFVEKLRALHAGRVIVKEVALPAVN